MELNLPDKDGLLRGRRTAVTYHARRGCGNPCYRLVPARMTKFRLGPGLLESAAFIGPGNLVTASTAGANLAAVGYLRE